MPLSTFLLPILLAASQAAEPAGPVVVTGHFWAPFISPMGEPFRARAAGEDTFAKWFRQADYNGDGMLTPGEMQADAERFFATLDTDHDGEIGPEELVRYEWEVAPDVQVMSRTRPSPGEAATGSQHAAERSDDGRKSRFRSGNAHGFQGAARYALLNMPEPVAAADADFDRSITLAEFRQAAIARFALLDTDRRGSLTPAQLETLLPDARARGRRPKNAPDSRIAIPVPMGN